MQARAQANKMQDAVAEHNKSLVPTSDSQGNCYAWYVPIYARVVIEWHELVTDGCASRLFRKFDSDSDFEMRSVPMACMPENQPQEVFFWLSSLLARNNLEVSTLCLGFFRLEGAGRVDRLQQDFALVSERLGLFSSSHFG